jgi:hypothetical protein
MNYEEQQNALIALRDARQYVQQAHDDAELKHNNYGDLYMDDAQWEIMMKTEKLLGQIADALRHLDLTVDG